MSRYGIAEWFGLPLTSLTPTQRQDLAQAALGNASPLPCPFQANQPPCRKSGGVCSFELYGEGENGRISEPEAAPVIICPARFEQDRMIIRWLAEIVGFQPDETMIAREIPFMQSISTNKPAGKIDLVLGRSVADRLDWYGLEIQAVYFSGHGMPSQFDILSCDNEVTPPYPDKVRRPDWRSSGAKRLMPQLQVKAPTVRRWQTKMAVAVDQPFFASMGGPSPNSSQDVNDGDIIWLVPELVRNDDNGRYQLTRGHWEVLTIEQSTEKLLGSRPITRDTFEETLINKLSQLD